MVFEFLKKFLKTGLGGTKEKNEQINMLYNLNVFIKLLFFLRKIPLLGKIHYFIPTRKQNCGVSNQL
jgi:hypothetical protein